MTKEIKLNKLFSDKNYVESIKDLSTLDEIFDAVIKEIPELKKEELDDYLSRVSDAMNESEDGELAENVLEDVSGGAVLETLAAAAGIITFCYGAGYAVGTAIKKWRS